LDLGFWVGILFEIPDSNQQIQGQNPASSGEQTATEFQILDFVARRSITPSFQSSANPKFMTVLEFM